MAQKRRGRRRLHLNLWWRIMLTITGVAVGVAVVGAWDSYYAHIPESRGQFLRKHYNRFDEYRKGLGRALAGTAAFIAVDPELRESMAAGDAEAAGRVLRRVIQATRRTVEPDLVLLVDRSGTPIPTRGATRLSEAETSGSRLIADLRNGMSVPAELAILGGELYQVSAAPIRTEDESVIGAIVLGHRLERYFHDYREQSDPNETKQHRLTFVDPAGNVLASVFPAGKHANLSSALQDENWSEDLEGSEMVPVIAMPEGKYDFWAAPARGYAGSEYGDMGRFFLMRTRDFKQQAFQEQVLGSVKLFAGVGFAAFIIGLVFAWWITRRINAFVSATEDLARGEGDLTRRLEVRGNDELAHLAENLNAVFAYTHDLAAKVQSSAFQVGASSAEISAASKQMLDGAQEQARKTDSSSAAVTELSASIQQVAENAMEATRVARQSGEAVQGAIGRMNEIRATVEEAAARIHELGESGKRIGNIVEVIRQISDQTTLLALNAAIEAAHAGEQGRGFAVVADEVSGLAKRVGQSARDIEDLIATIKEQTVEAVRAMETGTREVEAGTSLVTDTLSDLHTLVGVVEDTAKAVQEQAVASDEIARNMDVVQRIAQDVLGSSEEAVSQGEHLHRLAHELEESVKGFRITGSPSARTRRPALPPGGRDESSGDGAEEHDEPRG